MAIRVPSWIGALVAVGVGDAVGVSLGVVVGTAVDVKVGGAVCVAVVVATAVAVAVGAALCVAVCVDVATGVSVAVGVLSPPLSLEPQAAANSEAANIRYSEERPGRAAVSVITFPLGGHRDGGPAVASVGRRVGIPSP